MINCVQYSPSFQKKLVANVKLPSRNGLEKCSIYELDEGKKDAKKLNKQIKKQSWSYGEHFVKHLKSDENIFDVRIFSIEDERKNCLGLLSSFDYGKTKMIDLLEVNPDNQGVKSDRNVKNVGTSLVTYLFKSDKSKKFAVLNPVTAAFGFYDKVGFDYSPNSEPSRFTLEVDKVAEVIQKNEQKIGSSIEILG